MIIRKDKIFEKYGNKFMSTRNFKNIEKKNMKIVKNFDNVMTSDACFEGLIEYVLEGNNNDSGRK